MLFKTEIIIFPWTSCIVCLSNANLSYTLLKKKIYIYIYIFWTSSLTSICIQCSITCFWFYFSSLPSPLSSPCNNPGSGNSHNLSGSLQCLPKWSLCLQACSSTSLVRAHVVCVKSLQSCLILCDPDLCDLWAVAHQSMGFSKHECWSGFPCPLPGDLPDPELEPTSFISLELAGGFFTTNATYEALSKSYSCLFLILLLLEISDF